MYFFVWYLNLPLGELITYFFSVKFIKKSISTKGTLILTNNKVQSGLTSKKTPVYKLFSNGTLPLCLLASVWSAYLFWSIPPIWNSYDSYLLIDTPLKSFVIPHWTPLYPLFLKFFWLHFDFLSFNVKLYAIIFTQHILFIASVIVFSTIVTKHVIKKIVIMLIFLLNPLFGLMVHGIYTESVFLSLIIFITGLSIKIVTDENPRKSIWLSYFVVLFLACLTRHDGPISASILLVLLLCFLIKDVINLKSKWKITGIRHAKVILITLTLSCVIIFLSNLSFQLICNLAGADYYQRFGRAINYHIASAKLRSLPKSEFEAIVKQIEDMTVDPWVRNSVRTLLGCDNPWLGCFSRIKKVLTLYKYNSNLAKSSRELRIEGTMIMNQIGFLYIKSLNKYYIRQTKQFFKQFLMTSGIQLFSKQMINTSLNSLELYNRPPVPRDSYSLVPYNLICLDQKNIKRYENFKTSGYIRVSTILDYFLRLYIFIPIILIAYFMSFLKGNSLPVIISLIISIIIYSLMISAVKGYMWRSSLYNYVCLSASFCYFIEQLKIKGVSLTKT